MAEQVKKIGSVLVVGGGVAGIRCALDLADGGLKVYLLDKSTILGGKSLQLDKQFPSNDCGICKMLPAVHGDGVSDFCLRRGLVYPNIQVILDSELTALRGEAGDFTATVSKNSNYVDAQKCIGCGRCIQVCPEETSDEFNQGLSTRKAIYVRQGLGIPQLYSIDMETCTKCGECVKVCPTDAIDLSASSASQKLNIGAVVAALGFEEFDPSQMTQFAYAVHKNVVTSIELERYTSQTGPGSGRLVRPSDGAEPRSVAFLQCVGSRDADHDFCSSACCMFAIKEAASLKESGVDTHIFFMDVRAFGKGYHRVYQKAEKETGVVFTRCRVSAVEENPKNNNLVVVYETEDGRFERKEFEMVVLSIGFSPSRGMAKLSEVLGISLNQHGFCAPYGFSSVETEKAGIYVCGAIATPRDIPESVTQGSAAAAYAAMLLGGSRNGKSAATDDAAASAPDVAGSPKVGVFLCKCAGEVSDVVDFQRLAEAATELPDVMHVETLDLLCFDETQQKVKNTIRQKGISRVLFAACTPHLYQALFEKNLAEVGLPPSALEIANLREQVAWIHIERTAATKKAISALRMSAEKLRSVESSPRGTISVMPRALVIGGGMTGMTTALSIAQQGFEVDLVDKSDQLGGNALLFDRTVEDLDVAKLVRDTVTRIKKNKHITVHLESDVAKVDGFVGNFSATIRSNSTARKTLNHGAIVVATGASEHTPREYLLGRDERVVTQTDLEQQLSSKKLDPARLKSVVMIQCVGSRDDKHPYCSRICCSQAVRNAMNLKKANPNLGVYVIYRDIMTYGFLEEYYTKAREVGVTFLRYDLDKKPKVKQRSEVLEVAVEDQILGELLVFTPDLLVLSTGLVAGKNKQLGKTLQVPLDEDGFFNETNVKFRPLDFARAGVFVAGLAHSPRALKESMTQAQGAAARAVSILAKPELVWRGVYANVDEDLCSGCRTCESVCEYDAIRIKKVKEDGEKKERAEVTEAMCTGCGCCVAACPSGAMGQKSYRDDQVVTMISAALA